MNSKKKYGYEMPHYTEHELDSMDKETIVRTYCLLQEKFEHLRDCDYVDLKERLRIMTVRMFGRSSEKTKVLTGDKAKTVQDPVSTDANDQTDKDLGTDKENIGDGKAKGRPVRSKGCSDRVTRDLPVVDEDIELSDTELEAIFGAGIRYVDDPNFEKTYDEVCTLPCTHYIVR